MAGDVTRVLVGGRIEFPCPTGAGDSGLHARIGKGRDRSGLSGQRHLGRKPRAGGVHGPGGPSAIYIMNADGSGERRIFADKENWLDFLRAGSWSPDGKRLVFARGPSGVIRQPPTAD